jgi:hypothetical protein
MFPLSALWTQSTSVHESFTLDFKDAHESIGGRLKFINEFCIQLGEDVFFPIYLTQLLCSPNTSTKPAVQKGQPPPSAADMAVLLETTEDQASSSADQDSIVTFEQVPTK